MTKSQGTRLREDQEKKVGTVLKKTSYGRNVYLRAASGLLSDAWYRRYARQDADDRGNASRSEGCKMNSEFRKQLEAFVQYEDAILSQSTRTRRAIQFIKDASFWIFYGTLDSVVTAWEVLGAGSCKGDRS